MRIRSREMGIILQGYNLLGHLTIEDNVRLPVQILAGDTRVTMAAALLRLDEFGLTGRRRFYPYQLSGGERTRASVVGQFEILGSSQDLPPPHSHAIFRPMSKSPKRPRDVNQLARMVVDIAAGSLEDAPKSDSNPMAALGRSGGLKGGVARAARLTPEERRNIAQRAASARWKKDDS